MTDKEPSVLVVEPFEKQIERIDELYQQLLPKMVAEHPGKSFIEVQMMAADLASDMVIGSDTDIEQRRPN